MRHRIVLAILCLFCSSSLIAASALDSLYKKVPDQTIVFAATSGLDAVKGDFDQSILGQIANDPQMQAFFGQIMTALKNAEGFETIGGEGNEYLDFVKELLRSPTIAGVMLNPEDLDADPTVFVMSQTVTDKKAMNTLFESLIADQLESNTITKEGQAGRITYTLTPQKAYVARLNDYFLAVLNDPEQSLLRRFDRMTNYKLPRTMSQIPAGRDAFVACVEFDKIWSLLHEEAKTDADVKTVIDVLKTLGLSNMQTYVTGTGFEGSQLVSYGNLKMSASEGIWNAFAPVDRTLLNQADPLAIQASVCRVEPAVLYDTILKAVSQAVPASPEGGDVQSQIAAFEEQIGFKLRDDFLSSLEGSFLTYSLPAYTSPELAMGGYVLAARLSDADKFNNCMTRIGQLIAAMAPEQVQVTSRQTAGGRPIQIWAVGVMAMMQIIPSWAIEGDTLVMTSHPNLTGQTLDRIAAGGGETLLSRPEFASLTQSIPSDAFLISIADSKAQAQQAMLMLQQFWPMARMGVMKQGLQLPIMLPSIDAYIEKMEPSVQYVLKTSSGMESYYSGTGLEANPGNVAVTAMGAGILMPALSKTKKVAQRVVSGTNLKSIGMACFVYSADYDGNFPQTLDVLISECDLSPKSLISPRKPDGFEGPDYILVQGLSTASPATMVLAYENPAFVDDDLVNVLYVDGHVSAEDPATLKQALQKTYEYLNKPLPEMEW
jgi:prepilin-type processing-associated H-X9-DG protein